MEYLESDALLELLEKDQLLTANQHQFILQDKGKQRQKLLRQAQKAKSGDIVKPDQVDIIVSFNIHVDGRPEPLDEETIMRAVAREHGMEFRKLDPLDLDMSIVTKTIPRTFALKQLILPTGMVDGKLDVFFLK